MTFTKEYLLEMTVTKGAGLQSAPAAEKRNDDSEDKIVKSRPDQQSQEFARPILSRPSPQHGEIIVLQKLKAVIEPTKRYTVECQSVTWYGSDDSSEDEDGPKQRKDTATASRR